MILPDLKLPATMKRRGRPKNAERTTAIGLPKRSKNTLKFEHQPVFEKERRILSWLLNDADLELKARQRKIILSEEHVEGVDIVNNAIIDRCVDLAFYGQL